MKSGSEVLFHSIPICQPAGKTELPLTMDEIPALGPHISEVSTILMEVPSPQRCLSGLSEPDLISSLQGTVLLSIQPLRY